MYARLALAALLLSGCAHAPLAAQINAPRALAARSAQQHVTLTIPAARLAEAKEAAAAAFRPLADEWVTDMYGRKEYPRYRLDPVSPTDRDTFVVKASRDGFKSMLSEITMYDGRALGADLSVPYYETPGAVTYYIEVHATRTDVVTGKHEALPVRYVSNYGQNFQGSLR
jgi:hypothetical protein